MFDTARNKLSQMTSSSAIFRGMCSLTVMTIMIAVPISVEAGQPDEWVAKVVPIMVAPLTTIAHPATWRFGEMSDHGRGKLRTVTITKQPPRFCGCRNRNRQGGNRKHRNHGLGRKQWKHDRGHKHGKLGDRYYRKHKKHGRGGPKRWRPNKDYRKEFIADRKQPELVIVNVETPRTFYMPTASPTPVVMIKVSETVAPNKGSAVLVGEQLLYNIGTANAIWSVILIFWLVVIAFIFRGWRLIHRMAEPAIELEEVIELNPIVEQKSVNGLKLANDSSSLIDLESAFEPNLPVFLQ